MRFVIQVVDNAKVDVDGKTVGSIERGYLVLAGIGQGDTEEIADRMVRKLIQLRRFKDENGKTNLSVKDVGGQILLISKIVLCCTGQYDLSESIMEQHPRS